MTFSVLLSPKIEIFLFMAYFKCNFILCVFFFFFEDQRMKISNLCILFVYSVT